MDIGTGIALGLGCVAAAMCFSAACRFSFDMANLKAWKKQQARSVGEE